MSTIAVLVEIDNIARIAKFNLENEQAKYNTSYTFAPER